MLAKNTELITIREMSELALALPPEVVEFVAECRRTSYSLDAKPNYDTGKQNEFGFKLGRDNLTYVDISTEQNGRFAGMEYVERLNGQKFYICH